MKAREIRILVTLAEELHFGRAADRLGMAQPQLSETLRRIEADAGLAIFERRPRVAPTAGGEVILATARSVLEQLEAGAARARAVAAGQTGEVVLGFSPVAMFSDLPILLRRFVAENPNIELKLVEGGSGQLRAQLERHELDLIVTREEDRASDAFPSLRFAWDEVNLLLPGGHAAARLDVVPAAMLADDDFIFFPRSASPRYHDRVLRWARASGLKPKRIREAESWVAMAALVGAGLGVSLGTNLLSRAAIPGAVYRPIAAAPLDVSFWMAWDEDRLNPAAEKLRALAQATREGPR